METLLGKNGAYIDRIYYCPHHTDKGFAGEVESLKFNCGCRKPQIGLFLSAQNDLNIILENSWIIGDRTSDILAGQNAGMKSVLVQTGYAGKDKKYDMQPDFVAKNLNDAVKIILNEINK